LRQDEPTTLLQEARHSLGWKQSRVLTALATQAKADGVAIAGPTSLKTMLSRWENGNGQPDSIYQRLFCQIYERDPEELGFSSPAERIGRTRVASNVDVETVEYFSAVFDQHVRADQLLGPQHLVDVVRAQAELLDRILPDARPGAIRDELLRLSCRYNESAGWLYQDAGDTDNAMKFSDRAMERALALDDHTDTVYLLIRKSNIASDRRQADRAVILAEGASRLMHKVAPRVRALVLVQQARAQALQGAADDCVRSLDAAMREVSRSDANSDPLATYCTPEYVAMESAASWANLGQSAKAIPVLERALTTWPAAQRRDLGLCQARLAGAYADQGDAVRAAAAGRQAVATVRSATSARAVRELSRVRETLAPWRRESDVAELIHLVRGLTRAA
jgi:tetratricopeptide (TPR) repeat protein